MQKELTQPVISVEHQNVRFGRVVFEKKKLSKRRSKNTESHNLWCQKNLRLAVEANELLTTRSLN